MNWILSSSSHNETGTIENPTGEIFLWKFIYAWVKLKFTSMQPDLFFSVSEIIDYVKRPFCGIAFQYVISYIKDHSEMSKIFSFIRSA